MLCAAIHLPGEQERWMMRQSSWFLGPPDPDSAPPSGRRPPSPPPCVAALLDLFLVVGTQQGNHQQPVQPSVRLISARLQFCLSLPTRTTTVRISMPSRSASSGAPPRRGGAAGEGRRPTTGRRSRPLRSASIRVRYFR